MLQKLASENNFSSRKHIEQDFSTYSAKISIKSVEELKYHTQKHAMLTKQSPTRKYFLKSRSFRNSVRNRWFYFSGFH